MPVAGDDHRPPIEEGGLFGVSTPHRDAGKFRRPLVRIERTAKRRVNAVRADQRIAALAANGAAGHGIDETRRHAVAVLLDMHEAMPGPNGRRAQARPHRAREDHQQPPAMDRILRPLVAGTQAARLAPDQSAVLGVVGDFTRLDRRGRERGLKRQRAQRPHGVRQEIDADAEFPQHRHGLVDDGLDAGIVQAQRRCQTADAAAGDEDAHRLSPPGAKPWSLAVPALCGKPTGIGAQPPSAAPGAARSTAWVPCSLCPLESKVRSARVLGIVGAEGIGLILRESNRGAS